MSSRIEDLIEALLNGGTVDFDPHSRIEEYLQSCIKGAGTDGLPVPMSRLDILLYQLAAKLSGSGGVQPIDDTQTYILVTPEGEEIPAVLVEEETVFTATANDIREGAVAATDSGVTVGTKEIPAYQTHDGITVIPAGSKIRFELLEDGYTELQALICTFSGSLATSVATEQVVIEDQLYAVQSATAISKITYDSESNIVDFSAINESTSPMILRYMYYKEEY